MYVTVGNTLTQEVVLKTILKFFKRCRPLSFSLSPLPGSFLFSLFLINNIKLAPRFTEQIASSDIPDHSCISLLGEERVVNHIQRILCFYFLKILFNLLTKRQTIFFLAHLFLNKVHVFRHAFLLIFFGHTKRFFVAFAHMLYESRAITNEGAFNGVDQRTSP